MASCGSLVPSDGRKESGTGSFEVATFQAQPGRMEPRQVTTGSRGARHVAHLAAVDGTKLAESGYTAFKGTLCCCCISLGGVIDMMVDANTREFALGKRASSSHTSNLAQPARPTQPRPHPSAHPAHPAQPIPAASPPHLHRAPTPPFQPLSSASRSAHSSLSPSPRSLHHVSALYLHLLHPHCSPWLAGCC